MKLEEAKNVVADASQKARKHWAYDIKTIRTAIGVIEISSTAPYLDKMMAINLKERLKRRLR